jgi:hypothetical protein
MKKLITILLTVAALHAVEITETNWLEYLIEEDASLIDVGSKVTDIIDANGPGLILASDVGYTESSGLEFTFTKQPVTNLTWWTGDNENIELSIATGTTTNWTVIDAIHDQTPASLAVLTYDQIKEVGQVQTNRVLTIVHAGKTNEVILAVLGKEEWPSQKRTRSVPSLRRPHHGGILQ